MLHKYIINKLKNQGSFLHYFVKKLLSKTDVLKIYLINFGFIEYTINEK